MRGLVALVVVTLVLVVSPTPAVTAEVSPPKQCGRATLVTADGATGVGGSPKPHGDGYYTPVLMVHGWNGHPDMWWSDSDHTAQPGQKVSPGHSVASDVQRLRGAAVYTLDYHAVADRWFTRQGAGEQWFLDAARCLMDDKAFARHKMVVVAHSMGGLITRWAVTSDERIRAGTSLVLTLGTPYDGSWLATVGLVLLDVADVASRLDPRLARLRSVVHLLMLGCQANGKVPGCAELAKFLREIDSVRAFAFGSKEYATLKPWPSGIAVKTLTGRVLLENAAAEMFLSVPVPGDVDFGDGVVDVGSATNGRTLAVGECRYTASRLRANVEGFLTFIHFKDRADASTYKPLVEALFGSATTTCGHLGESRLIQLTKPIVDQISQQLTREEPDPHVVRFDGIGEFTLRLTAADLKARGYVNQGNLYEGPNASCVSYTKAGQPVSFSVESTTGRVLALNNASGDRKMRTEIGGIHAGSTLAQLRSAFAGYRFEEHFDQDFGQGGNGIVVDGAGGSIGFSLADAPSSDYVSGRAEVTFLHGVGLAGHAPSMMEDGC